jgi:ABC-type transport system substrate-binding protein
MTRRAPLPNLAGELERVGGLHVPRMPSTWIIYLGLNAFNKPLSDVRVREARWWTSTPRATA